MKKNIFIYLLIIVVLISFMLAGCISKSEKRSELEKNQKQLQKEMTTIEQEAKEAKQPQERVEKTTQ